MAARSKTNGFEYSFGFVSDFPFMDWDKMRFGSHEIEPPNYLTGATTGAAGATGLANFA
jgi:hypothetical protein